MCTGSHHHAGCGGSGDAPGGPEPAGRPATATRRRFLLGGAGIVAGAAAAVLGPSAAGTAGAALADPASADGGPAGTTSDDEESDTSGGTEASGRDRLWVPAYLNRPSWGADEGLRLDADGVPAYPVRFYRVQKITIHHSASWTPWSTDEAVELVDAIYREHVAHDFGDIGYHLLIDPLGTVYEGRYSGGTSFPVYDNYPGWTAAAPRAVNAAHLFNYNAGNVGIALLGDHDVHDVSDEAWWALQMTVAMICSHTGLDPEGESLYRNPVNGIEQVLPNVVAHGAVAGTLCPGAAVVDRFDELRAGAAAIAAQLDLGTWLA